MKPTPEERLARVVRDARRGDVPESLMQLVARLDEPPPGRISGQMWSVASLVIAGAVVAVALWISRSSAPPPVGGRSASPSPSIATASTVPTPAGVLGLAVGASQVLSCDADFPSFSPDGRWLACGTQLESWPDLTTVAALTGSPVGWSARDQLLVLVSNNQYRLVTPQGAAVDLKLNPGDMPEWSSDGQRLLLHSDPRVGDRLRLGVWIADGTIQPLVDLPAAGADRIDLSSDGNTVLRSSMMCGSPGCQFAVTASRPDGSGAVTFGPVTGNATFPHLAPDGKLLVRAWCRDQSLNVGGASKRRAAIPRPNARFVAAGRRWVRGRQPGGCVALASWRGRTRTGGVAKRHRLWRYPHRESGPRPGTCWPATVHRIRRPGFRNQDHRTKLDPCHRVLGAWRSIWHRLQRAAADVDDRPTPLTALSRVFDSKAE